MWTTTFLLVTLIVRSCRAQLYPYMQWKANLLEQRSLTNGGLRKGNGVVLSRSQEELWITDSLGSLHVIYLNEERRQVVFTPDQRLDRATESRSLPTLHEDDNTGFVVYTVLDLPFDSSNVIESRVICVDTHNALLWTAKVLGSVVGNAQISSDGKNVVVIHNAQNGGKVSVLRVDDGVLVSQKERDDSLLPFGPPKLLKASDADLVFWGESTHDGYADEGKIFHMKMDGQFDIVQDFAMDSSTGIQPTVSEDGSMLWLGGKEAHIYGWNLTGDRGRAWTKQLAISRRNATAPITNYIAAGGSRLFVASATNSFHCLDANDGSMIWSSSFGSSVYLSSAKYNEGLNVVYSIQHLTGKVIQYDGKTGDVLWHYDCVNITSSTICMDSVEAESSLSHDGTMLYYGDIYGTVYALAVSDEAPTHAPSLLPSSSPSLGPSQRPTLFPTSAPSSSPSAAPSGLPSVDASESPSSLPSKSPSSFPSSQPSISLSSSPSLSYSSSPSLSYSSSPSIFHSSSPSSSPTVNPTSGTSFAPTMVISSSPTISSSDEPLTATEHPTFTFVAGKERAVDFRETTTRENSGVAATAISCFTIVAATLLCISP